MLKRIALLRGKAGLDAAVLSTLLARGWSILSGVVTLWLVAKNTTPAEQGYYYTFSNILGLQVFFELGLSFVLMQTASHEAKGVILRKGVLSGDGKCKRNIYALMQLALRIYLAAALLFLCLVALGGFYFFSRDVDSTVVTWRIPWVMAVVFFSGTLFLSPMFAIFEGLGGVTEVARVRLVQFVFSSLLAWGMLFQHQALYALAASGLVSIVVQFAWTYGRMRKMLLIAWRRPSQRQEGISWRKDIWPFQWRIAVSWMSGYFIFQIITPLVFSAKGAGLAGKVGMAFSMTSAMTSLSMAWINTKAPTFGVLISSGKWHELNRLYARTLRAAIFFLVCICISVILSVYFLRYYGFHIVEKMPTTTALVLMSLAAVVNQVVFSRAIYLRAGKREPFMLLSICVAVANVIFSLVALHLAWDDAIFAAYLGASMVGWVWSGFVFRKLRY